MAGSSESLEASFNLVKVKILPKPPRIFGATARDFR